MSIFTTLKVLISDYIGTKPVSKTISTIETKNMTQLRIDQQATIVAAFNDVKGNATAPTVTPSWSLGDATLASISSSTDGLTGTVVPTGTLGATKATITHGAITSSVDLEFVPGLPATVTLTAQVA